MRALKLFLTAVISLVVLSVIVGFIAREILLIMAVNQVRASARGLSQLQAEPSFIESCRDFGSLPFDTLSLTRTQLRFVSDTDYVLEIVCQTNESLRSTIRTESLPALVEKGSGQSGLIQGEELHGFTVAVLGRTGAIYEEDSFIRTSLKYVGTPNFIVDQGPVTVCEGYGFRCCNNTTQIGQGAQQSQALDCPLSCYDSCAEKPVVLNFASDPEPTVGTRVATVQANQPVSFYYALNDIRGDVFAQSTTPEEKAQFSLIERWLRALQKLFQKSTPRDELDKIVIAFGDGATVAVSDLQGTVSHTYTCDQAVCVYNAVIQALTKAGTTSALTEMSRLELHIVSE